VRVHEEWVGIEAVSAPPRTPHRTAPHCTSTYSAAYDRASPHLPTLQELLVGLARVLLELNPRHFLVHVLQVGVAAGAQLMENVHGPVREGGWLRKGGLGRGVGSIQSYLQEMAMFD
jgi:hypothetical protein